MQSEEEIEEIIERRIQTEMNKKTLREMQRQVDEIVQNIRGQVLFRALSSREYDHCMVSAC